MNFLKPVVSASMLLTTLMTGSAMFANKTLATGNTPATCQYSSYNIPESRYQSVYNNYANISGNRPLWVDGYDVKGKTYYNVIFNKCYTNYPWVAKHKLDATQYQQTYNQYQGQGYRLYQLDSYLSGGKIYYSVIYVKDSGPAWKAYTNQTVTQFQSTFDSMKNQGYRPVNISVVKYNGTVYYTSLYDKKSVGTWYAYGGLTATQYKQYNDQYKAAGLHLAYLNGYKDSQGTKFAAIWNKEPVNAWYSAYGLKATQYKTKYDTYTASGYYTNLVTGYEQNGKAYFGALWTK